MGNQSSFQLIILIVFVVFLVLGVLLFTGVLPGFRAPQGGFGGEVTLWTTIPDDKIRSIVDEINRNHREEFTLNYVAKEASSYESDLIEALAAGTGPDLFELPSDLIGKHEDKTFVISFESLSERGFKNMFIEEGELYLTENGAIGLPLVVDPMVMYWNRDIFSGAGIANPPRYWDEFLTLAPALTRSDQSKNILQSAIAFGEFENVRHAKDILALLILQAGNKIIIRDTGGEDEVMAVVLARRNEANQSPAESALRFYTEFSNPSKPTYSWNRALPLSSDLFARGDLAVYFGYASERAAIVERNPHLNLDVAPVPQIRNEQAKATFGRMDALAIARNSKNIQAAFSVAYLITGAEFGSKIAFALALPPARRDLLSQAPPDAFDNVYYESAIMARGWLDPNPGEAYTVFQEMVEGVSSGRMKIGDAIINGARQLDELVR